MQVACSEEVQVFYQMVEVVDIPPVFIAGIKACLASIGFVKAPVESSEEFSQCQIRFGVPHISCWVDQPGMALIVDHVIPRPEITVEQGRPVGLGQPIAEIPEEGFDLFSCPVIKIMPGAFKLGPQSAFREKSYPAVHGRVVLNAGSEEMIVQTAVFSSGHKCAGGISVHPGEPDPEFLRGASGGRTGRDVFHQEERITSVCTDCQRLRRSDRARLADELQTFRLSFKDAECWPS